MEYKRRHTALPATKKHLKQQQEDPLAAATAVLTALPDDGSYCLAIPLLRSSSSASGSGSSEESDGQPYTDDSETDEPTSLHSLQTVHADTMTRAQLLTWSAIKFSMGTLLCLAFADPMVGAVVDMSNATAIPAFFIAFVAAPLASNASELVSSIRFALARKSRNISITFHQVSAGVVLCVMCACGDVITHHECM